MLGDVGFGAVLGAVPYGGAGCCAWAAAGPTTAATLSAAITPMFAKRDIERGFICLFLPSRYSDHTPVLPEVATQNNRASDVPRRGDEVITARGSAENKRSM